MNIPRVGSTEKSYDNYALSRILCDLFGFLKKVFVIPIAEKLLFKPTTSRNVRIVYER